MKTDEPHVPSSSTGPSLRLPIRNYQIARLYGPGMPPSGREGLREQLIAKPIGQVGLVLVHCWNLGEPTAPYPITENARCPGEAADWVPRAREITRRYIVPVLQAARVAGIRVFHLAQQGPRLHRRHFQTLILPPLRAELTL